MKKISAAFLAILLCLGLLGCNQKHEEETPPPDIEEKNEEQISENEFYKSISSSKARPFAVMIDNDADYSGPHAGLENAYLIYEIYVEGGSTRMMALFNPELMTDEQMEEKIGPVRSSRHYFLDFALENNAIYAHCGFSPQAEAEIKSRGVNNINGLYESAPFFRYSGYNSSWHNLYTSMDRLKTAAEGHNYSMTGECVLNFDKEISVPEEGAAATSVNIPYLIKGVSYSFDEETGLYRRFKKGQEHQMQSGAVLTAENIIVLRMDNYDLNDGTNKGRQNLSDTGTGSGMYITGGKCQAITWKKANRDSVTKLYYENGDEVFLNPGVTFVQIVPSSMNVTTE